MPATLHPASSESATVVVARHAMHTRFEILLHGDDPTHLRAAGEQALDEIERLEAQLSLYRPTSEIAEVNRHAGNGRVRVSPSVYRLLLQARDLSHATGGAFDPTIAPLVQCWGFLGGEGRMPDAPAIAEARSRVGMHLVELNDADCTVRFTRPGMMLDLGAIGKGYAIDQAVSWLREAGVRSAFLHGGTSSSYGLGCPPDADCWKAAISDPRSERPAERSPSAAALVAEVPLLNASLGVSGIWSKWFERGGRTYGHVLDPRLGEPVQRAGLAAVVLPSATETDALSTALLILGVAGMNGIARLRPEARLWLAEPVAGESGLRVHRRGSLG